MRDFCINFYFAFGSCISQELVQYSVFVLYEFCWFFFFLFILFCGTHSFRLIIILILDSLVVVMVNFSEVLWETDFFVLKKKEEISAVKDVVMKHLHWIKWNPLLFILMVGFEEVLAIINMKTDFDEYLNVFQFQKRIALTHSHTHSHS